MKQLRFLTLGLSLCALSACQTLNTFVDEVNALDLPSFSSLSNSESRPEQLAYSGNCPEVKVVEELRAMNEFTDMSDSGEYNLISRVNIAKVNSSCSNDAHAVTVDLKMNFEGLLGPRAKASANDTPYFSYPFFVAITNSRGDIMAKEIFSANITYPVGKNRQTHSENMRQIIPIEKRHRNAHHKILIGFQLGPDQLAYNREKIKKARAVPPPPVQKPEYVQPETPPNAPTNINGTF